MESNYTSAISLLDNKLALKAFFFNNSDSFEDDTCDNSKSCANTMLNNIISLKTKEIIDFIDKNSDLIEEITPANIVQFSNIDYIDTIVDIVKTNPNGNYELYGYYYNKDANEAAHRKYGENHYKMASYMGLVTHTKPFKLTLFGEEYSKLSEEMKKTIRPKLILRIPIIQKCIVDSLYGNSYPLNIMRTCLRDSTVDRRRSNIRRSVREICDSFPEGKDLLNRFIWE